MENPIKMDDLGVPLFLEASIWWKVWERNEHDWVGGFKYFLFSSLLGKMIQFD